MARLLCAAYRHLDEVRRPPSGAPLGYDQTVNTLLTCIVWTKLVEVVKASDR